MTIKQLEYFMAIARTLSFSEAAKQMYVSQPALSRSISALEEEMGVSLIHRDTHYVSLTPAGSILVSTLPKLATKLSQMVIEARQAEEGQKGRLLLGIVDGLILDPALQAAIDHFRTHLKEFDIQPVCLDLEAAIKATHDQEVDMLYAYDTSQSFDNIMDALTLAEDRFCAAVSCHSGFANVSHAHLQDFLREKFYITGNEASTELHRWKEICAGLSFMPQFITVPNPGTQAFCVEHGFGIAILPERHHIFSRPAVHKVHLIEEFPLRINLKWSQLNANPCIPVFLSVMHAKLAETNKQE